MSVPPPGLLFLTQHFPPEEIGSAPYCGDLAVWLGDHGYEPHVLTGQPHYPARERFAEFRARHIRREIYRGIRVERVNSWTPAKRGAAHRIVAELHFLLLGLAALVSGRIRRNKLVLSLGPSILCVALGIFATRRGGRHVVLLHDIQSGLAKGLDLMRSSWLLRLTRWVERAVLNRATVIAVLTPEMRNELIELGVHRPIEVLPLWVDTSCILPLARPEGPPTLLYSGNLGLKQGLAQILDLAAELRRRKAAARLVIRGAGSAAALVAEQVRLRDLENVNIEPLLPADQLARGLAQGDVHLVPQLPDIAAFAVPSKIFNIMAAGRPFIATARPESSLWRLAHESEAFVCVPPNDPVALADAATSLLDDPDTRRRLGQAGRSFILAHHGQEQVMRQLATLLGLQHPRLDGSAGTIIFEPDRHGHPLEWLQHLVRFAVKHSQPGERLDFVVASDLAPLLASEVPPELNERICVTPLGPREERYCRHRSLAVSGMARWLTMRRHLRRSGATRGCFLSLDHLSLPLALGLGGGASRLDGVLFRPSVHYRQFGDYRPTWPERLRDFRKAVLYRRMLRNRSLRNVLSLDPFFPDYAASRYRGGGKVVALPDPVYRQILRPEAGNGRPTGRTRFLLFGHLTERKGVLVLLEALALLPAEAARAAAIDLAGGIDDEIRDAVLDRMRLLRERQPELDLTLVDRRVPAEELQAMVEACDVVLAPYQRFVGSSGVLLWAASAGKPVLTQDFGLLGRLVSDNRLGITVDTTDPKAIAAALGQFVAGNVIDGHFDRTAAAQFVADRTPERFAAEIIGQ